MAIPTQLYGTVVYILTAQQLRRIEPINYTLYDHQTNEEIRSALNICCVTETCRNNRAYGCLITDYFEDSAIIDLWQTRSERAKKIWKDQLIT